MHQRKLYIPLYGQNFSLSGYSCLFFFVCLYIHYAFIYIFLLGFQRSAYQFYPPCFPLLMPSDQEFTLPEEQESIIHSIIHSAVDAAK